VVLASSWLTHLDFQRRSVAWQPWLEALTDRYTLIRHDPRGCGLSDRLVKDLTFGTWVRDLGRLVDHLALPRFALIGACQGGAVALEYAARNPGRVGHLVLYGTFARGRYKRTETPVEPDKARVMQDMIRIGWGKEDNAFSIGFAQQFQPKGKVGHLATWCELQRRAATPEDAIIMTEVMFNIDIRSAMGVIGCPTLVAHANQDSVVPIAEGRILARGIRDARFLELDTVNHFMRPDEPEWDRFVEALHAFLPNSTSSGPFAELSEREREVLELLARGRDNGAIGQQLGLSGKTVRNHVSNIFSKIGLHSRGEAIVKARDAGFGVD
jgi:pimeloyl-ACP methyl ester carboxylesterase